MLIRITIIVSFVIVLGLVVSAIQVPTVDQAKVNEAIEQTISQINVTPEYRNTLEKAVFTTVKTLEKNQRKRLRFLVSAYLVIWLVFMLYLLRLGKQQQTLDQRISQLEEETPVESEESV
ncbi:hypothetical protein C6497_03700 [Candidatus Poribacteria bacterium]|nr:MAG: hypothetical protein C6497_03700 [Candidatus Poribacteria bacterium]